MEEDLEPLDRLTETYMEALAKLIAYLKEKTLSNLIEFLQYQIVCTILIRRTKITSCICEFQLFYRQTEKMTLQKTNQLAY